MIRLIKCEFMKTRRCYVFICALILTAAALVAGLHGNYGYDQLRLGWRMFLYQLPLINAIFLPIMCMIISSRLCGIEYKDMMLRRLCCTVEHGKLYDAKLIYGMSIMIICIVIMWCVTVIFGMHKGFHGEVPIKLYLLYLLYTILPTISVYIFQHTLSMLFKNQAVSFFGGIAGEAVGLFSMFLPSLPWLRRFVIWGHYGALQFVGLFDWTKETKYANAHFDLMFPDAPALIITIAFPIIMYIAGRYLFSKKEM